MNLFLGGSFRRRIIPPSSFYPTTTVAGAVISSIAACCYCYYSSDDIGDGGKNVGFCEDGSSNEDGGDCYRRTGIWGKFIALPAMHLATTTMATMTMTMPTITTTMTTTHCLAGSVRNETVTTPRKCEGECEYDDDIIDRPRLIFLGTGSSTGCPKPICAMKFKDAVAVAATAAMANKSEKKPADDDAIESSSASTSTSTSTSVIIKPDPTRCRISYRALAGGDPKTNRDYRNNPSLLIHHYDKRTDSYKNIVIDVGKTFRETALRWFPINGVESLDAIILTHHHMDAAAGLDDVRGFQRTRWVAADEGKEEEEETKHTTKDGGNYEQPQQQRRRGPGRYVRESIPLYMSDFCHLNLQSQFPWLLPKNKSKSEPSGMPQQAKGRPTVTRDVASFDVTIFKDYQEEILLDGDDNGDGDDIQGGGFKIVPLPVWHGDDLISHGFAFSLHPGPSSSTSTSTSTSLNVVYLSDISRMVPETLEYIQNELPPTDVLIVDSLLWEGTHVVHYSLEQAVELARTLKPRMRTYLIGMSCDNFLPHNEMNAYLRNTYGKGDGDGDGVDDDDDDDSGAFVMMAHDGLVIDLPDGAVETNKTK